MIVEDVRSPPASERAVRSTWTMIRSQNLLSVSAETAVQYESDDTEGPPGRQDAKPGYCEL